MSPALFEPIHNLWAILFQASSPKEARVGPEFKQKVEQQLKIWESAYGRFEKPSKLIWASALEKIGAQISLVNGDRQSSSDSQGPKLIDITYVIHFDPRHQE